MFALIVWTLDSQLVGKLDSESAKKSLANFQSESSSKDLSGPKSLKDYLKTHTHTESEMV